MTSIVEVERKLAIARAELSAMENRSKLSAYRTPRNMVTGLLNRIDASEVKVDLERCTFIALSIFHEDRKLGWVRPFDAHAEWVHLLLSGFTTSTNPQRYSPAHDKIVALVRAGHGGLRRMLPVLPVEGGLGDLTVLDHVPTAEEATSIMRAIYKAVDVPCDGVVVQPVSNKYWQRRGAQLEDRPPFMVAVKLDAHEQANAVGKIGSVEWNVSKRGLLKPRLILEKPLNFDGVEVTYATANNASFVRKWGLRAGRSIKMVRSGDVIPRVVAVKADGEWHPLSLRKKVKVGKEVRVKLVDGPGIKDARAERSLPTKCPACSSKLRWTPKGTDLECMNGDCESRRDRSVASFFRTLGVDDVASGTIGHLIEAGMDTVPKILRGATVKALRRLENYGDKKAALVSSAIAGALKDKPLATVMHASGVFSSSEFALGSTRLQAIVDHVGAGGVARGGDAALRRKLATLSGLGKAGLDLFLKRLPAWRKFYADVSDMHEESSGPKTLKGVRVAFTGFRDAEAEKYVLQHGGSTGGVSKNTTVLFAAALSSGKAKKADALDIPVVAKDKMWAWLKKRGEK